MIIVSNNLSTQPQTFTRASRTFFFVSIPCWTTFNLLILLLMLSLSRNFLFTVRLFAAYNFGPMSTAYSHSYPVIFNQPSFTTLHQEGSNFMVHSNRSTISCSRRRRWTNESRYYLGNLDADVVQRIHRIILHFPAEQPYQFLRSGLIAAYSGEWSARLTKFFHSTGTSDRRPSELYEEIQGMGHGYITEDGLRTLWIYQRQSKSHW